MKIYMFDTHKELLSASYALGMLAIMPSYHHRLYKGIIPFSLKSVKSNFHCICHTNEECLVMLVFKRDDKCLTCKWKYIYVGCMHEALI